MPGTMAKCLGFANANSPATPRVLAVGCHLPLASSTGFGMMYSGMMDETAYDRQSSILKAALIAGGWRENREDEKEKYGHAQLMWPSSGEVQYYRTAPMRRIAEFDAPSICLRVAVDRLRRQSFMKYDDKAWLGNPSSPLRGLAAPSVDKCVQGQRPVLGMFSDKNSNCRYYAGCVLRLMFDFDKIPGVSSGLVNLCKEAGRQFAELDLDWMQVDNEYWMKPWGASIFNFIQGLRDQYEPGFHPTEREGIDGFLVGDIVRLSSSGSPFDGKLHTVVSVELPNKLCIRRGEAQETTCFPSSSLNHVAADEWMEDGMEARA